MTEEERQQLASTLREQLEREHEQRLQQSVERSSRRTDRHHTPESVVRAKAEQVVREQFFTEKGYKKYENSRGEIEWLLPEEYERRMKARKNRKKRRSTDDPKLFEPWMWAALAVGTVLAGIAMAFVLSKG